MFDRIRHLFGFFRNPRIDSDLGNAEHEFIEATLAVEAAKQEFLEKCNADRAFRFRVEINEILSSGWDFNTLRNPEYCIQFVCDILSREATEADLTVRQAALLGHVRRHYAVWMYNKRVRPYKELRP